MSLYRSPDINRLIYKCLHDEMSTNDGHIGYTFHIGSYVKTLSADCDHLEWRFGSGNMILKVHHPRTIHAMFALNQLTRFSTKKHKFCRGPFKDHPCDICFKLVNWCQSRKFSHIFPIGSCVKTMSADGGHLEFPIGIKRHNFCRGPSNDHPCNVCFELVYWFQRRDF